MCLSSTEIKPKFENRVPVKEWYQITDSMSQNFQVGVFGWLVGFFFLTLQESFIIASC